MDFKEEFETISLESSMDVLVIYPGPHAELITIPKNSKPFTTYFGTNHYYLGHSSKGRYK